MRLRKLVILLLAGGMVFTTACGSGKTTATSSTQSQSQPQMAVTSSGIKQEETSSDSQEPETEAEAEEQKPGSGLTHQTDKDTDKAAEKEAETDPEQPTTLEAEDVTEPAAETAETSEDSQTYLADALLGTWAERYAGRGVIEITNGSQPGLYTIIINWGNGAAEYYNWEIYDAPASSENVISYDNCRLTIHTFDGPENETLTVKYENGTGQFYLNDAGEVMWQDDVDQSGSETSFINARY